LNDEAPYRFCINFRCCDECECKDLSPAEIMEKYIMKKDLLRFNNKEYYLNPSNISDSSLEDIEYDVRRMKKDVMFKNGRWITHDEMRIEIIEDELRELKIKEEHSKKLKQNEKGAVIYGGGASTVKESP